MWIWQEEKRQKTDWSAAVSWIYGSSHWTDFSNRWEKAFNDRLISLIFCRLRLIEGVTVVFTGCKKCWKLEKYIFSKKFKKRLAFSWKVVYDSRVANGSLVKRLRRRPLTAETGVRFPYGLFFYCQNPHWWLWDAVAWLWHISYAGVAELADAHDSKSCGAIHVGSSPTTGTLLF